MKNKNIKEIVIYQAKSGKIEFKGDFKKETIWGTQQQIADLFGRDKSVISRHIKNIFNSGELDKDSTVAKIATVQSEGEREVVRELEYYSLDMIISVGYRVDSQQATRFRVWSTQVLRRYLLDGYVIDRKKVGRNYESFMVAMSGIRTVLPKSGSLESSDVLDLVNAFAASWFSLDAYDSGRLPEQGVTKRNVMFTAEELADALTDFRCELIRRNQTTVLFGQERYKGTLEGIVGNIFQSFRKKELYITVEQKAAHLLYFIVKDHPFADGNKRSGAFAFVWFLRKSGVLKTGVTPEALTVLT
ncbi:RhuM family protein, partial [Patescibacteria group bacterium]